MRLIVTRNLIKIEVYWPWSWISSGIVPRTKTNQTTRAFAGQRKKTDNDEKNPTQKTTNRKVAKDASEIKFDSVQEMLKGHDASDSPGATGQSDKKSQIVPDIGI